MYDELYRLYRININPIEVYNYSKCPVYSTPLNLNYKVWYTYIYICLQYVEICIDWNWNQSIYKYIAAHIRRTDKRTRRMSKWKKEREKREGGRKKFISNTMKKYMNQQEREEDENEDE